MTKKITLLFALFLISPQLFALEGLWLNQEDLEALKQLEASQKPSDKSCDSFDQDVYFEGLKVDKKGQVTGFSVTSDAAIVYSEGVVGSFHKEETFSFSDSILGNLKKLKNKSYVITVTKGAGGKTFRLHYPQFNQAQYSIQFFKVGLEELTKYATIIKTKCTPL